MGRPEGGEFQEGRGASVISPITQVTALDLGRKRLKSRTFELERVIPQARMFNGRRGERPGKPGTDPDRGINP